MELILKYFPFLSENQKNQFTVLGRIFPEWNEKINLVSRKDIDQLYLRHVLHSLAIAGYTTFLPATRIMDLGTGGGFPGIPLAIFFPEVHFVLVDSILKKTKAVEEICRKLQLKNVEVICARAESVRQTFDFVVTRAVAPLNRLATWTRGKIITRTGNMIPNGIIALKGGELTDELEGIRYHKMVHLKDYFAEPFFEEKKLIHI